MTGAEVAVPAAIAGIGAIGSAAGGKSSGSQAKIPSFFKRTAGPIATDIRFGTQFNPANFNFDPETGALIGGTRPIKAGKLGRMANQFPVSDFGRKFRDIPLTSQERSIAEAQNFFATLRENPNIQGALSSFRELSTEEGARNALAPEFENLRAEELEQLRRTGGLFSTAAQESLSRGFSRERRANAELRMRAGGALLQNELGLGQAQFLPAQTSASILATLGGATQFQPPPQFSNAKGAGGELVGTGLDALVRNTSGGGKGGGGGGSGGGTQVLGDMSF